MITQTMHQQLDAINKRNKARICELLEWTEENYNIYQYNSGLAFLAAYFNNDGNAIDQLTPRKEFWNWWKGLWNGRDSAFVDEWDGLEDSVITEDMRTMYSDLNGVKMLASEIFPPEHVYPPGFTHIKIEMS